MISMLCPHCRDVLEFPESLWGKAEECPQCHRRLRVFPPAPPAPAATRAARTRPITIDDLPALGLILAVLGIVGGVLLGWGLKTTIPEAMLAMLAIFGLGCILLAVIYLCVCIPVWIAEGRGHADVNSVMWLAAVGFLIWPVWLAALIWACVGKTVSAAAPGGQRYPCPFCAEPVLPAARLCPHCHSELVPR